MCIISFVISMEKFFSGFPSQTNLYFFGEHKEQITNKNEINKCDFKISRS